MADKKVKNQLREKLTESIHEAIISFNSNVGGKLKKAAIASAKKISNKFAKTVKEMEKAERKIARKNAKKAKKATKANLKSLNRVKNKEKKDPVKTSVLASNAGKSSSLTPVKKTASGPVKKVVTATPPVGVNGKTKASETKVI